MIIIGTMQKLRINRLEEMTVYGVKLCLALNNNFPLEREDQVRAFHEIGFEAFFSNWKSSEDVAALRKVADEEGMIYQSIHAPFGRIDRLWEPTEETESVIQTQLECLRACADNGVPLMVAHAFIGFTKHNPTPQGLENFERIVREAERLDVQIAFENTEGEEYLAALMEHFKGNPSVGFCWDTGHEMCYNHSQDMLALYGDRLLCTHLNDNLGIRDYNGKITFIDDLHLLPFDGIADWQGIVDRLNRHGFSGILTFELTNASKPNRRENDAYHRMDIRDYLTLAYMRACRVAALKTRG